MKQLTVCACLLLCMLIACSTPLLAQKDKIEGIWHNDSKSAKIQIYKANDGKFWGKIIWLAEPNRNGKPKVDERNPNAKLRNTPIIGYPILQHLEKDGENGYANGKIYDPKNGKTYSCKITMRGNNELGLRGYMGVSMLGRTSTWTRAE